MEIKVNRPAPPAPEPTFEPSIVANLGGGFLVRLTRTDLIPQESNILLVVDKEGKVSRPELGKNFKEYIKVDGENRVIITNPTPV